MIERKRERDDMCASVVYIYCLLCISIRSFSLAHPRDNCELWEIDAANIMGVGM